MGAKIWKATKLILLGLLALVISLIVSGLIYRAWYQHRVAKILTITAPNGIDERRFVRIGGIDQWITVRGYDRNAAAILFVHGGPGIPNSPLNASFAPYEKAFVVVQWDQRGAGRTYSRSGPVGTDVGIDRMAEDGIEVADYVRSRLRKDKIILVGISWGSDVGVRMVKARPELFAAYVGTAQVVNSEDSAVGYSQLLTKARVRNDAKAMQALLAATPPYSDADEFSTFETWALTYEIREHPSLKDLLPEVLTSPDYDLKDVWAYLGPGRRSSMIHFFGAKMDGPFATDDVHWRGTNFATPIFIFQGAEDDLTPASVTRAWFDTVSAPEKAFVLIPGGGHAVVLSQPDTFIRLVEQYVSPLTVENSRSH